MTGFGYSRSIAHQTPLPAIFPRMVIIIFILILVNAEASLCGRLPDYKHSLTTIFFAATGLNSMCRLAMPYHLFLPIK
jgi:hypothetical protein